MNRSKRAARFTLTSGDSGGPSRRAFGGLIGAGALIVSGCGGGGDSDGAGTGPSVGDGTGGSPTPPPTNGGSSPVPPVATAPQITAQPAAQQVNQQGQMVRFSVQASGDGLRYQWTRNGVEIAGTNASVYELVAQAADDGAQFAVVVSNSAGSVNSNAAGLTIGLSFDVAAALRTWMNTSRALNATGPEGSYAYALSSTVQTDASGATTRVFSIQPQLIGSDPYPISRRFALDLDGRLLNVRHTTSYDEAFLTQSRIDGWGIVTSQQALPQSAKPGSNGVWLTTRNWYNGSQISGSEISTTTYSFSLEADGESGALLRLKDSTVDKATGAILTGEYVLRISTAGDVTPVSDSSTIRTNALQIDLLAKPMFAVANAVKSFLSSPFEDAADGVKYKLEQKFRGPTLETGAYVTSFTVTSSTDISQWRYWWDQNLKMVRTDRTSGTLSTFDAELTQEAGLITSSPPLPTAVAVGATGVWFVANNVTTVASTGTTTATFNLEPDTDSTALLKLNVRVVSTDGGVRNGQVILRIGQSGNVIARDTDKAILSLFNPA